MKELATNIINKYLEGSKLVLIDVGARGGINDRWKNIYPMLNVVGFEPDEQECERINFDTKSAPYEFHCYPYALGQQKDEKIELNICRDPGCTSAYAPNTEFIRDFYYAPNMQVIDAAEISLNTLDHVCDVEKINPDCLKIDTQGYELEILKGASNILPQVKLLELEVEFNPQYRDQPLFSNVDIFLREHGFMLLGIRRTIWRRTTTGNFPKSPFGGQLIHGDAIYYNANLLDRVKSEHLVDLIKFCTIFSIYRQDDFVSHLMSHPEGNLSNLSESERKTIVEALLNPKSSVSSIFSALLMFIRKKIFLDHRSLRRSLDTLQSKDATDWHDPDFF